MYGDLKHYLHGLYLAMTYPLTHRQRWLLLKAYIPGTRGWGTRRYLKRRGLWPGT